MLSQLVGRDRELALLLRCLRDARLGRANLVVCVGGPGVGKTRLVEELARSARERGVLVTWGRGAATPGAPPYWPWREVLRLLDRPRGTVSSAEQLLELSGEAPSLEVRARRFDDVARLVLGAARSDPLVLVLDDMDDADEPSQLLVQYLMRLARDECLLVVVCCRQTSGPLAGLAQEAHVTQVELQGLDRTAVGELLSGIVGRPASDAELGAVYDATAGNPFFVGELARQVGDGIMPGVAVPQSVQDAIGQRLGRLSPACALLLGAAAILGTRFDVPVVAAMTNEPVGDCLLLLDEAAKAALVVEADTVSERRFAHDLIRDAIVCGLDARQRARLHRAAAQAIDSRSPHEAGATFDVAHHWVEAAVDGDRAMAATWAERAGREAMQLHAYEEGLRWYGSALDLGAGASGEVARCQLMIAYAGAQCLSSDFSGALGTCLQAVELAVRIGRPDLAVEAALVPEPTFDERIDELIRALCEAALAVCDSSSPAVRARVLARYAWVCDHLSDLRAAHLASEEALVLADASGDATALEAALAAHHMVRSGPDGLAEREVNADRMWALGKRTGRPDACLSASEWRFDAASERGDLGRAARELQAIARWAAQVGGPWRSGGCCAAGRCWHRPEETTQTPTGSAPKRSARWRPPVSRRRSSCGAVC